MCVHMNSNKNKLMPHISLHDMKYITDAAAALGMMILDHKEVFNECHFINSRATQVHSTNTCIVNSHELCIEK